MAAAASGLSPETVERIMELTHGLAEAKIMLQTVTEKEGEHHVRREAAETSHAQSLANIVSKLNSLKILEQQANSIAHTVSEIKKDMDGMREHTRAIVNDVRAESAAVKQAIEELAKQSGGGGGGWLFPLCVCAQALVVAAGLFYSMYGGGSKKSKGYLD